MTSVPNLQISGVDKLILAAQYQSKQQIPNTASFYFREPSQVPTPKNKSELELYQLLKRANLTVYFPTFIKYGGDDVTQLAEASEDEFLEIVELIGMHQKPLHVRRLQKALAHWREDKFDALENERQLGLFYDTAGYFVNQANVGPIVPFGSTPNLRSDASIRSDRTRSSVLDESIGQISTASRSLFPVNNSDNNQIGNSDDNQQQYCTPHVVIRNAPKRPRLMDSIKPSDLTKGIQMYDNSVHSTPIRVPPPYQRGRGLKQQHNSGGAGGESPLPTTPIGKRHPIQISPPDSAEADSDDSSDCVRNRSRARRKAIPTKSK